MSKEHELTSQPQVGSSRLVRFPKAKLVEFKVWSFRWKPMYVGMANGAFLWWLWFNVRWRMPWLPQAAASVGWDECFRQVHKLGEFDDNRSGRN